MKDPLPSDIFHPGQVLNNTYEIEGVLGRGGTGEVYLARNQISERRVAIKALSAQFSGNADYVELMKREEQMRNILHDAVVRYTECSRSDQGHVFLVMDYIDGPSMNDEMPDRRLDDRDLMVIAHRVASGLVVTHARGIVHRDLSPDNIVLRGGDPDKATIIDFGIAKDTAAGARTIVGNQFAGKYEYAAPEQLEGRAEPRSDLYALGASLLAAWRGEVPFLGATPGEIIRRKQQPLDTDGVPEPLKGLIDTLSAPDPAQRPADAAAAVARIEAGLKPLTHAPGPTPREPRRGAAWLALPALALVAGVAAWALDLFDVIFPDPLPVASPYRLAAAHDPGTPGRLTGNAPDEAAAAALAAGYAEGAGKAPAETALTLATGLPREDWPAQAAGLLAALAPLDRWQVEIAGLSAQVNGLAPDGAARDALAARLDAWSVTSGIALSVRVAAGPERLDPARVQAELDRLATCGPLDQQAPTEGGYALGATILVTGDVAAPADKPAIEAALAPLIGDRRAQVETRALNRDLCAIRAVLPHGAAGTLSVWLGNGETGAANLTGVYRVGENPVAEVLAPASLTQGSLWVMVVDNTGKVFHVLPQINHTEHALTEIGRVEGGLRRVRVLHSVDEFRADQRKLAFTITDGDFGKSEIIAILSTTPLFDMRRPRDESVTSVAEALAETLAGRKDQVIAVASRIIDARR